MQSGNCYPCRESLATTNDAMVGTWQNVLAETMHVCVCVCGYINRNKQGKIYINNNNNNNSNNFKNLIRQD